MLDRLRIRRHYKWVPINPGQMVLGGTVPLKLEHRDELGYLDENNEFKSIPIIEMPKPEYPAAAELREHCAKMNEAIAKLVRDINFGEGIKGTAVSTPFQNDLTSNVTDVQIVGYQSPENDLKSSTEG